MVPSAIDALIEDVTILQVIWSSGATASGSSGSPLIDVESRKVVGVLTGGFASCQDRTGPDYYGRLSAVGAPSSIHPDLACMPRCWRLGAPANAQGSRVYNQHRCKIPGLHTPQGMGGLLRMHDEAAAAAWRIIVLRLIT